MNKLEVYKELVLDGIALEKNRISFSKYVRLGKTYYQVHSDNYKCRESHMFKENDIDEAVNKFSSLLKVS